MASGNKKIANLGVGVSISTKQFNAGMKQLKAAAKAGFEAMKTVAGVAIAGLGTVFVKTFRDMESAQKELVRGGSYTTEALAKDWESVTAVMKAVPSKMTEVAKTVDVVGDRIKGLSVDQVTKISLAFEKFGKISGTAGSELADDLIPVLNLFNTESDKIPAVLSTIASVAMKSGVGVGKLVQPFTTYGAAFKAVGLDLLPSINLIAAAANKGLSGESLAMGLNIFAKKAAEASGEMGKLKTDYDGLMSKANEYAALINKVQKSQRESKSGAERAILAKTEIDLQQKLSEVLEKAGKARTAYSESAALGGSSIGTAFQGAIEKIRGAGSELEATRLGAESFGRSGVQLAEFFRTGLDTEPFETQLDLAGAALDQAEKKSRTLGDQLQLMWNNAQVAMAPYFEELKKKSEEIGLEWDEVGKKIGKGLVTFLDGALTVMQKIATLGAEVVFRLNEFFTETLPTFWGDVKDKATSLASSISKSAKSGTSVFNTSGSVTSGEPFASGGSFEVPAAGYGGIDGVPLSMMVDPGEFVSVSHVDPAKYADAGTGQQIIYNITCSSDGVTSSDLKQWAVQIQNNAVNQVADEASRLTAKGKKIRGIK